MIREDAIKTLKELWRETNDHWYEEVYNMAINALESIPSADRPQGEWIYCEDDVAMCDGYRCDKCGFFVPWDYEHKFIDFINDYHFCPNCGVRMKGVEDDNND